MAPFSMMAGGARPKLAERLAGGGEATTGGDEEGDAAALELGDRGRAPHRATVVVGVPEGAVEVGDDELDGGHRRSLRGRRRPAARRLRSEHAGVDAGREGGGLLADVGEVVVGRGSPSRRSAAAPPSSAGPVTMRVMSRTAPVPSLPPLLISRYGRPGLRLGTSSNHG